MTSAARLFTRYTARRCSPRSAPRASQLPHLTGSSEAPTIATPSGSNRAVRSRATQVVSTGGGGSPMPHASTPPSTTIVVPGHVCAAGRGEERDQARHLLGAAEPAERYGARPAVDRLAVVALQALGEDRSGRHADGADAVPAPLERQSGREVRDRCAPGGRVGETGDAAQRAEADEHDQAAAARDHRPRRDGPGDAPDRIDGDALDRAPALVGDLLGRRRELAAGVVDEHVERCRTARAPRRRRARRRRARAGRPRPRRTRRPRPRSPRARARAARSRRPHTATRAPLAASSIAVARPMPVPPPVTSATRPALASGRRGERYSSITVPDEYHGRNPPA